MRLAPALVLAVLIAGCGGSSAAPSGTASPAASRAMPRAAGTPPRSHGAQPRRRGAVTAGEEAVIRGWADALRNGDVDAAVKFWAIPAVASNGGDPIRLVSASAVRFFNETLPCGARLESTERSDRYILATFVLTERPGPGECGSGTGHRARTAFLLRHGKIVQWLRAPDPPAPASEGPGGATA